MIEENTNSIMKSIFKIIFNRWVLFTHHQIKFYAEPKAVGATKLISSIHNLFTHRKSLAFNKIHLYHLFIESFSKINQRESQTEDTSLF